MMWLPLMGHLELGSSLTIGLPSCCYINSQFVAIGSILLLDPKWKNGFISLDVRIFSSITVVLELLLLMKCNHVFSSRK